MVAEVLQSFDQPSSRVCRLQPVEKGGPGCAVGIVAFAEVMGHPEDGVGHRQQRALLAAPCDEPRVAGGQIGAFGPRGCMGGLHQGRP